MPTRGAGNPGFAQVTTPGSFANSRAHGWDARGALTFSSPDTPGMPAPSTKTAWDFLPSGWSVADLGENTHGSGPRWSGLIFSRNPHISPSGAPIRGDISTSQGARRSAENGGDGCADCLGEDRAFVEFVTADNRRLRVIYPRDFRPMTQLEHARLGIVTPQMKHVATREPHLTGEMIRDEIAAGRMILPANIHHLAHRLEPMVIGRASKTKVNANMGASPVSSGTHEEVEKLQWAERWGADTVMDLSTGGNLDECRDAILRNSTVPIGTVPIYSMIIGRKIEDLTLDVILSTLEHQARQGVDYFTIHAGVLREHLQYVKNRLIGIVSRGGSLLAKWCLVHDDQNPMYTHFEAICDVMREHDVSFSLGDGLRPGGLADASDDAQLAELETLGELTERAWRRGCQVMVEGPGHVPLDQIEFNMKLQRTLCHGAPFYVLGPLVTDVFPGYDHITSCIGATSAAYHGASMLCYVTPKEHLGLPKKDDVKQGCIAYKIAAHAGDVALGIPGTREWDDDLTKARAALNWEKHFELAFDTDTARAFHDEDLDVDTDFCAMCGHDWCSVRISKEIQEFASGKAEGFERGKPVKSAALTIEQKEILEKRGVLSPEEIHRLAAKTRKAVGAESGKKAGCHSDYVEAESAKLIQANP
ncbi:MAG: phosphomethylpyrimidine synthase [Phycisphaerales bacterium]